MTYAAIIPHEYNSPVQYNSSSININIIVQYNSINSSAVQRGTASRVQYSTASRVQPREWFGVGSTCIGHDASNTRARVTVSQ